MTINTRTYRFYFLVGRIYFAWIESNPLFQLLNQFLVVFQPLVRAAADCLGTKLINFAYNCLNLISHSFLGFVDEFRKKLIFYLYLSSEYMAAPEFLELPPKLVHILIYGICYFGKIYLALPTFSTLLFVVLYWILSHFDEDRLMLAQLLRNLLDPIRQISN